MNPIQTKVAAPGGTNAPQALQGSTSGVFAGGTGNFFDMIIARLAATETAAAEAAKTGVTNVAVSPSDTAKASINKFAPSENPLAALQVALATQSTDANGNIVLTPVSPQKAGTLQTQLDVTNQIINHLNNISTDKDGILGKVLAKLQSKSETLQASLTALENGVITKDTPVENIPEPLLISLGLTPAQITEATVKIQDLEQKLGRDITVEDLIAGVGGIVPPAPQQAVLANLQAGTKNVIDTATDAAAEPTDDLAAQLNALDVGGEELSEDELAERAMKGLPESDAEALTDKPLLKPNTTDSTMKKDAATFKENLVNLMNTEKAQTASTDLTFPSTLFSSDTDSAIYAQYGLSPTVSTSLGTTAQAANLVSSPTIAGQNHPATQLVAATISKSAANGTDQTMNIRLDPPELGNVNVRLQFGKDKAVKAHIVVEKAETFMMLQRDSHALERALQSAGLDTTAADAISFELAQDNGQFNPRDGESADAGNSSSSGNKGTGGMEEIVQSSVTWQVDPSTGHVRYNLFA